MASFAALHELEKHMSNWRIHFSLIAAIFLVVAALHSAGDAVIELECNSSNPPTCPSGSNGVMLVAKDKDLVLKDTQAPNQDVIFSSIEPEYKRVMAFRKGYKPAYLKDVVWTSSPLKLKMEKQIDLKIRFWALCPDEAGDCSHPLSASDTEYLKSFKTKANAVLRSERVGIRLVAAGGQLISDTLRTEAGASDFKNYGIEDCIDFKNWVMADAKRSLDNAINIYLVSKVDNELERGRECQSDKRKLILIAANIDQKTILHEIGHTLSLEDLPADDVTWDGEIEENYMHEDSSKRKYFTEAQIYRIYVNDKSAVNQLPPGPIVVYCGGTDADAKKAECPKLAERIWTEN